jgi:hypothetical protein
MKRQLSILSPVLVCCLGCSAVPEDIPPGPIARFGSTPTIDGVFEDREWDDAELVQAGEYQQFRIKHDGTNLYFALVGDGGDLYFNKDTGLQVLHASAQLGSAEYMKSDTPVQSLGKCSDFALWGLQNESATVVREKMAAYLAENGWVGSIGGSQAQTEFAVSFNWLGVPRELERFAETPGIYIYSGRSFPPEQIEELRALSLEERKEQFPTLYWPRPWEPIDTMRLCSETLRFDSSYWGKLWIDLQE